jgi:hypothetical protein
MTRILALLIIVVPVTVSAQLLPITPSLPSLPKVGGVVQGVADEARALPQAVTQLAQDRLSRLDTLIRSNPATIARDDHGDPARAGEVIVDDPDDALIAGARAAGFTLIEHGTIEGLNISYGRFQAPPGKSLPAAIRALRKLAGKRAVSADQLHFQSGNTESGNTGNVAAPAATGALQPVNRPIAGRIGMVDGGVGPGIAGTITRAGFARGAGMASSHGSAIASLILGAPGIRASAAGARLWTADVYGNDPAGGSALAIAQALGWLSSARVPVTVISLVGPPNPLLARVAQAVQIRGMIIVAAVGNDGAAAPPAYPASYPGVIAVTGVDGRNRVLIETGQALHLDYAAPGADMLASNAQGHPVAVRGTSFAAPFVAARIAAYYNEPDRADMTTTLRRIDGEARRMGPRYGRGLVCADCRTPAK